MIISVVNHSSVRDDELQAVIRAVNRQIAEDFLPYWSFGATLRLEGKAGTAPKKEDLPDLRGDAIIYLWEEVDVEGALGYHDANNSGIPYGFVFPKLSAQLGEKWTVTLSHEALELLADPQANLLVQGPHPEDPRSGVFHWFEMCDAVQGETYKVDGIDVSNFVLPMYFTEGEQEPGRNDFLGMAHGGRTLRSFGVNPGGYIGFFDPKLGDHTTWQPGRTPSRRLAEKQKARAGRGILIRLGEQDAIRARLRIRTRDGTPPKPRAVPRKVTP